LLLRHWLVQQLSGALNFGNRHIVLFPQRAFALSEHVAHDPQPMLHVIERNQPVIKHQHRIEQSDLVAAFRQPLISRTMS
jgi:hypothetical protein